MGGTDTDDFFESMSRGWNLLSNVVGATVQQGARKAGELGSQLQERVLDPTVQVLRERGGQLYHEASHRVNTFAAGNGQGFDAMGYQGNHVRRTSLLLILLRKTSSIGRRLWQRNKISARKQCKF